jgi:hypothetical protein
MKVIFNRAIAGVDLYYAQGQVVELPAAVAKRYIEQGICSIVEEKKVAKAERAVSKKTTKRTTRKAK